MFYNSFLRICYAFYNKLWIFVDSGLITRVFLSSACLLSRFEKRYDTSKKQLGAYGEDLATKYLIKAGYRIVARNWKARYGELDIVCVKDNTTVFVEVKTRSGRHFGRPEEAVTRQKLEEILRTASVFTLAHDDLPEHQRIDVITVELGAGDRLLSMKHILNVSQ